jgi:hypothetical protein
LLGLRHAGGDGFRDRCEAAIALQSHWVSVRSGPSGVPFAFAPWQPVQVAPPT